ILVGTRENGLLIFSPDNCTKTQLKFQTIKNNGLKGKNVWCIKKGKNKYYWVGTDDGLCKIWFMQAEWHFENYNNIQGLSGCNIWDIYEDDADNLWLASTDDGLKKFNLKTKEIKKYSTAQGFPIDVIAGILPGNKNTLWVSTISGLCLFDIAQGKVLRVFDKKDGLQGDYYSFKCRLKNKKGELLFGGCNGLSVFNPDEVKTDMFTPNVQLTSIKILNKEYFYIEGKTLVLPHDSNSVSIDFASLDYTNSSKNKYAYKLSGVADKWVDLDSRHSLFFSRLSSGTYTLFLKGTNSSGIWSNHIYTCKFIIKPPYWKTWWFLSILFVVVFSIVFYLIHKNNKNKSDKRKFLQSELALLRTQLNPHFIFNSMSLLQQFITSHQEELALKYLSDFSKLMRQILENSQKDFVSLREELEFIRRYTAMETLAEKQPQKTKRKTQSPIIA
ncbi:MAG: histidine kinase, partial [Bacteroidetes bacterium]|nr:histidine kinase [Bacteroidota bacterium]